METEVLEAWMNELLRDPHECDQLTVQFCEEKIDEWWKEALRADCRLDLEPGMLPVTKSMQIGLDGSDSPANLEPGMLPVTKSMQTCSDESLTAVPACKSLDTAPSTIVGEEEGACNASQVSCSDLKGSSVGSPCESSELDFPQGRGDASVSSTSDRTHATEENEADLKRHLRLIRNRESASQSRMRKKSYMKELQLKCRMLENQVQVLQQTVAFKSAENSALKEELVTLKSMHGNDPKCVLTEPAALSSDSLPSESPSHHTSPCLAARWELAVCLCHALLLTLFHPRVQKLANVANFARLCLGADSPDYSGAKSAQRTSQTGRQLAWLLFSRECLRCCKHRWRRRLRKSRISIDQSAHYSRDRRSSHGRSRRWRGRKVCGRQYSSVD